MDPGFCCLSFGQLMSPKLSKAPFPPLTGPDWPVSGAVSSGWGASFPPDLGQSIVLYSREELKTMGRGVSRMIPFVLMKIALGHTGDVCLRDSGSHSCNRPPGPEPSPHIWILIPVSFCAPGPSLRWGALFPATAERSEDGLVSSLHWRFRHALNTSMWSFLMGPCHPLPSNFQP